MDNEYLTVGHLSTKDLIRIFSKISIDPSVSWNETSCWAWLGSRGPYGHGRVKLHGRNEQAHRVVFAWLIHQLPRGMKHGELDHLCQNPPCCNPLHLEFVDGDTNKLRGNGLPALNARKDYCLNGHPFSGENLALTPRGRRVCVTCRRKRSETHRRKHPHAYDEQRRAWRIDNKDRDRSNQRAWVEANRDWVNERARNYRAKKKPKPNDERPR